MDAKDKDLRTPLLEAIINNHIDVARYLIQNGACVYHVVSGAERQTFPLTRVDVWKRCAFVFSSSGGRRVHRPSPRSQVWQLGDRQNASGDRAG